MKLLLFSLLSLICCNKVTSYSADTNKPNIIFLVADDLGWNDVGYHGASNIETPNIDDLANSGLRLESHYVLPLCSPTRAALLTGRYPIHSGIQSAVFKGSDTYGLSLDQPILPELVKKLGYSTHMIGKWHLGYAAWQYTPTYRGFDTFFGFYLGEQEKWHHLYEMTDSNDDTLSGVDLRKNEESVGQYDDYYSAWLEGNETIEVLNDVSKTEDPFFLYLAYSTPHKPVEAPPYMVSKYSSVISNPVRQEYSAMVDILDDVIGNVVAEIKKLEMWDNTLLIFFSDNGGEMDHGDNFPLCGNKNTLWEGGTRSPTFISGGYLSNNYENRNEAKTISNELIHVVDWFPTVLSLIDGGETLLEETNEQMQTLSLNDDYVGEIDGINQWSFVNGESNDVSLRDEFLYNIDPNLCVDGIGSVCGAIRYKQYKLILANRNDRAQWSSIWQSGISSVNCGEDATSFSRSEISSSRCQGSSAEDACLFDIETDPCELYDISDDNADMVELMFAKLQTYYNTMNDPLEMLYNSEESLCSPDNNDGFWSPFMDLDDYDDQENPYKKSLQKPDTVIIHRKVDNDEETLNKASHSMNQKYEWKGQTILLLGCVLIAILGCIIIYNKYYISNLFNFEKHEYSPLIQQP